MGRERNGPMGIFFLAGLAALGVTLVVKSYPDLRRYLRFRSM